MIKLDITWIGTKDGYFIKMNGEQIHYSKTIYDRDMFMAELKGKLFIAQNKDE